MCSWIARLPVVRWGIPQKRKNFPSEEIFAPNLRSLSFAARRDSKRQRIHARSRKIGFAPAPPSRLAGLEQTRSLLEWQKISNAPLTSHCAIYQGICTKLKR